VNIDWTCTPTPPPSNTERQWHPMNAKTRLYESWKMLLRDLLEPLLVYLSTSMGHLLSPVAGDIVWTCSDPRHDSKTSKILCLYFNCEIQSFFCGRLLTASIQTFALSTSLAASVSPSCSYSFTMASSQRHRLNFRCLFKQSCDATNALLVAIQSFYSCRGFILKNAWVGPFESLRYQFP
jgi:hypothetical protein